MAHAVVAYRAGKSPLAKFVTLDAEEAEREANLKNGGRGTTYYKAEEYNPDVHTGQPKMTPEAEAEIGPLAIAQGQLNRIKDGYNHPGEEQGERPADEEK